MEECRGDGCSGAECTGDECITAEWRGDGCTGNGFTGAECTGDVCTAAGAGLVACVTVTNLASSPCLELYIIMLCLKFYISALILTVHL